MRCVGTVMAHEGITGPPQPYEGRGGLWSREGRRDITLPVGSPRARAPADGIQTLSGRRILTGHARPYPRDGGVCESGRNRADRTLAGRAGKSRTRPKWIPQSRNGRPQHAVHSRRALIDGEIYLGSFHRSRSSGIPLRWRSCRRSRVAGRRLQRQRASPDVITKKNGRKEGIQRVGRPAAGAGGGVALQTHAGPPADNGRDRGEVQSRV